MGWWNTEYAYVDRKPKMEDGEWRGEVAWLGEEDNRYHITYGIRLAIEYEATEYQRMDVEIPKHYDFKLENVT